MNNVLNLPVEPKNTPAPLSVIEEIIVASGMAVNRRNNTLVFTTNNGQCNIEVDPVHIRTIDGQEVTDIVKIQSELPEGFSSIDDSQMVIFNTMIALGALVRNGNSGQLSIVSRLSVYQGDDDAWNIYIPLIAFSALLQGDALLNAVNNGLRGSRTRFARSGRS